MDKLLKSNKNLAESFLSLNSETKLEKPYFASTNDINITVWPEFVDNKLSSVGNLFIWAYHIRIENKSKENIRLINRYWRIIDEQGNSQEVSGEGVVGEQPLIIAGASYQYSSGVHLQSASGIMTGHYEMRKDNGETFKVKIPSFSLDMPNVKGVIN